MNIPTKDQLKQQQGQQADAQRQQLADAQVRSFSNQIVAAMGAGKSSITSQLEWPLPEAESRLRSDFEAKGWTLTFTPMRSGGTISWS